MNYRERGGLQNGRGGEVKFYPYENRARDEQISVMLKEGGGGRGHSFGVVAGGGWGVGGEFHLVLRGGGGGHNKFRTHNFPIL